MNKRLLILLVGVYSSLLIAMDNESLWHKISTVPYDIQKTIIHYAQSSDQKYKDFSDAVAYQVADRFEGFSTIYTVAISPNGKTLAASGDFCFLKVWDIKTKKQLFCVNYDDPISDDTMWSLAHSDYGNIVIFSPDSRKIATVSSRNKVQVRDVKTAKLLFTTTINSKKIFFSSDSARLVIVPQGNLKPQSWDIKTGQLPEEFPELISNLYETSMDGRMALVKKSAHTLDVVDIETKGTLTTIHGYYPEGNPGLFLSNNKVVALGQDRKTVNIWDVEKNIGEHSFGSNGIWAFQRFVWLCPTADKQLIAVGASGGTSATIYLWDLKWYGILDSVFQLKPLLPQEINAASQQEVAKGQRRAFWRAYFMIQLVDAYKNKKKLSLDPYGKDGKGGFKYIIYTKFFDQQFQKLFEPFVQIKKQTLFSILREKIGSKS